MTVKGGTLSESAKKKISIALTGRKHTEKELVKMRSWKRTEEYKQKIRGRKLSDEHKQKISVSMKIRYGDKRPDNWKKVIPKYCSKFNEEFKEKIRERFDRTCIICGIGEEEYMSFLKVRGKRLHRLHIHHVNYDKDCLCNEVKCEFVPLCSSCHGKTNGGDKKYWEDLIIDTLKTINNLKRLEEVNLLPVINTLELMDLLRETIDNMSDEEYVDEKMVNENFDRIDGINNRYIWIFRDLISDIET